MMRISDKTNPTEYRAVQDRYDEMTYRRCGNSGIKLPAISLGLWHNFGFVDSLEKGRNMLRAAFDAGITHFDLANNYGPPYGSAEENFGIILKRDFCIIATNYSFRLKQDTTCGLVRMEIWVHGST